SYKHYLFKMKEHYFDEPTELSQKTCPKFLDTHLCSFEPISVMIELIEYRDFLFSSKNSNMNGRLEGILLDRYRINLDFIQSRQESSSSQFNEVINLFYEEEPEQKPNINNNKII